jgi:hypothetical protein
MAPSSAAIHLNLTRERRTFLCRFTNGSDEYRVFMCHPTRYVHDPLDIEGSLIFECFCGKLSCLQ